MSRGLSAKQLRFIAAYAGNGTEAARQAGYRGSDNTLAQVARENLRHPQIREAIRAREQSELRPLVANRQQRQTFWTRVMTDEEQDVYARLKASELLGRSEADFKEKVEHSGAAPFTVILKPKDG